MKKLATMAISIVLIACMVAGGSLAYLQDQDEAVNVMTLGSVKITQHEYERVLNDDGTYKINTIDNQTSYVLQDFTQDKPLLPIVGDPSVSGAGYAGWDDTTVRMSQVNSYGGMDVFAGKNAQDKFVTVENTGKSDAYVRTFVAIEVGTADADLIGTSYHSNWTKNPLATIEIDDNNYFVIEYVYNGASDGSRHVNGVLPAGDTTYPNLSQVYLKSKATNEDMEKIDGNKNGKLDIIVLSQAVQTAGFEAEKDANEDVIKTAAQVALDTAFGEANAANVAEWFDGIIVSVVDSGTMGGVKWTLTDDGTLTVEPDSSSTIAGKWSEAVIYDNNGNATAIGGYPYDLDAVKSLVIKEGVTSIGSFTAKFKNLTGEVVIPASVTYIGQEAFQNCENVTKLTFAEGGTEKLCIAPGAFKKLGIEEIVLPADRPEVHVHCWAFNDCLNLEKVTFPANVTTFSAWTHVDYCGMDYVDDWDSQILARCWNLKTLTFGSQEVRDMFFNAPYNTNNINAIGNVNIVIK